jgi:hypothetical protein|tara:strand:- start:27 stop:509 length:483 start_codon:yes stop_codon:yes gene_type:complete
VKTLILDNFLSKEECKFLIEYYESNTENIEKFRDVFPLTLHFVEKLNFLTFKLNKIAEEFNAQIDWFQIVKWPKNSFQELHFDTAKKETVLSSIVYLNDNFEGGQTYFEEGTMFKPKKGRGLFFDGQYYKHGVTPVKKQIRYVVATWYKKIKSNPSILHP